MLRKENINRLRLDSHRPFISEKLFGPLWYKGEVCILFSDANVGKSTLANDVAIGLQDKNWNFFEEEGCSCEITEKVNLVYFDLEMSDQQYLSKFKDMPYVDFLRLSQDYSDSSGILNVEEVLSNINAVIVPEAHNLIILDNLSAIDSMGGGFNRVRDFMYQLKRIVALTENTSILLLAHTIKRKQNKPISQNDLLGSKAIMNFCDSAFALGKSVKGEDVRYIKQIKSRMTKKHDDVAEIRLLSSPYPHFEFVEWNAEEEHLKNMAENTKIDSCLGSEIMMLHRLGRSVREISSIVGISKSSVHRYIVKS